MNYFKQVCTKGLSLFHKHINDLAEGRKSVMVLSVCFIHMILFYGMKYQNKMLRPISENTLMMHCMC
jgi:hypothetical protein